MFSFGALPGVLSCCVWLFSFTTTAGDLSLAGLATSGLESALGEAILAAAGGLFLMPALPLLFCCRQRASRWTSSRLIGSWWKYLCADPLGCLCLCPGCVSSGPLLVRSPMWSLGDALAVPDTSALDLCTCFSRLGLLSPVDTLRVPSILLVPDRVQFAESSASASVSFRKSRCSSPVLQEPCSH